MRRYNKLKIAVALIHQVNCCFIIGAMRSDGSCFTDKDLHAVLRRKGFRQLNEGEDRNEWFRNLNSDIETIIAKSEKVKKAKKEGTKDLTPKQKKELSDEEKEYKSKRKQIQEKLIKFATRIPVFMYLTDYRERCLKDVITQLEPGLFKKVTGLSVKDFELLVSLGVFNDSLMNDAVYKFKRYEDASLSYTGIDRHEGEDRGGWDTVLSDADYNKMFTLQQASMEAPAPAPDDLPAKPYFSPDEDEPKPTPAKNPAPQPTKPIISFGGFTPKINTAQSTQASGSRIHKPSNSYAHEFQTNAERILTGNSEFTPARDSPISVAFKSNDFILCQMYREGALTLDAVRQLRRDDRKLTYTRQQADKSIICRKEVITKNQFIDLIQDATVQILF